MLLVIGGLFVNHLFAKVGLFWLAGYVGKTAVTRMVATRRTPSGDPGVRRFDRRDFRACRRFRASGRNGNSS